MSAIPHIWTPNRDLLTALCPHCGKPRRHDRLGKARRFRDWLRAPVHAMGRAFNASGLVFGASGMCMEAASGSGCGCGTPETLCPCETGSSYTYFYTKKIVTISGWSCSDTIGSCFEADGTSNYYNLITTLPSLNGTWCLTYDSTLSSQYGACAWSTTTPCLVKLWHLSACSGTPDITATSIVFALHEQPTHPGNFSLNVATNTTVSYLSGSMFQSSAFTAVPCRGSGTTTNSTTAWLQANDISGGTATIQDASC